MDHNRGARSRWTQLAAKQKLTMASQIHVAFEREPNYPSPWPQSSRHACFALPSPEALFELQNRIWEHRTKGSKSAALSCDEPGQVSSGDKVGSPHSELLSRWLG